MQAGCARRAGSPDAAQGGDEVTIAVMVVDDSVVVRRLIVDALDGMPDIKVVGTASNGRLAQAKIDQLKPDASRWTSRCRR